MKRCLLIAVMILLGALATDAQDYTVLKNINNDLLYSDSDGQWLTRKAWQNKHGRKAFRAHFGDGSRYDHSQEIDFLREDIQQSITLMGEGNIVWSRVVKSSISHKELKIAARKRMANVIYETENTIIGGIIEHGFIRDHLGRPWGIKQAHWKGIISYEFKDGRYKVTVSQIQYKAERGSSLGIYSLSFVTEKTYAPFANLLYPYSRKAEDNRYYRLVDFLDYNFTSMFVLFETSVNDNDW